VSPTDSPDEVRPALFGAALVRGGLTGPSTASVVGAQHGTSRRSAGACGKGQASVAWRRDLLAGAVSSRLWRIALLPILAAAAVPLFPGSAGGFGYLTEWGKCPIRPGEQLNPVQSLAVPSDGRAVFVGDEPAPAASPNTCSGSSRSRPAAGSSGSGSFFRPAPTTGWPWAWPRRMASTPRDPGP
jgi:hypothetical protein